MKSGLLSFWGETGLKLKLKDFILRTEPTFWKILDCILESTRPHLSHLKMHIVLGVSHYHRIISFLFFDFFFSLFDFFIFMILASWTCERKQSFLHVKVSTSKVLTFESAPHVETLECGKQIRGLSKLAVTSFTAFTSHTHAQMAVTVSSKSGSVFECFTVDRNKIAKTMMWYVQ